MGIYIYRHVHKKVRGFPQYSSGFRLQTGKGHSCRDSKPPKTRTLNLKP